MTLSRNFWLTFRRALLLIVDAIEVEVGMERTADLRKRSRFSESVSETEPVLSP